MRKIIPFFLTIIFFLLDLPDARCENHEPAAAPGAVVEDGKARFTVLTSRLIRMEWSEDGVFEDQATLAIVNRRLPVPDYQVRQNKKKLVIQTKDLKLTYSHNKGCTEKFDSTNLVVEFRFPGRKGLSVWYPGKDESGNLMGTARTLDGCDGLVLYDPYEKGVLSKDGWAIVDESDRQVLVKNESDWGEWVQNRTPGDRYDLYLFAYGHDYMGALADFTKVAGKIPLPPRYAFGYWWSRYWQYSDFEFVDLAKKFRAMDIPVDVMIIDMDWHDTWTDLRKIKSHDEFGQSVGWTGYTWQKQLFPNPSNFLRDIHDLKMKTSLNLHPASGIQPQEECYDRFVQDYLARTAASGKDYDGPRDYRDAGGKPAAVPFRICDQDWTDAYFHSVIHPLEDMGVDFWWLDWQQWKLSKYLKGLNNTFWLNYTFFNDKVRQHQKDGLHAERPMIYHRWGGIGSHRYQIGFSGDTYDVWTALQLLPYFTSTSSNVCYGYWGHDIGGHMQKTGHPTDPELYTRWLQYGVFTPIFKTHSSKSIFLERRIWMFPEHYDIMKAAIDLRYSLSPYIYNSARQAYDTGVSICRPMYYFYPEDERAYTLTEQFMFGDDIMATALCQPADTVTHLTSRKIWFPAGDDWYDVSTGTIYQGGQVLDLEYTLAENPYFVKCGSVIPMAADELTNLQEENGKFKLLVVPGNKEGRTCIYEDDGSTQAYTVEYARTEIEKRIQANEDGSEDLSIIIHPRTGDFRGALQERAFEIDLEGYLPPCAVLVNGQEVPYFRHEADSGSLPGAWTYDGKNLAVKVVLRRTSVNEPLTVKVRFKAAELSSHVLDGKKGLFNRMAQITPETKLIFGKYVNVFDLLPEAFLKIAQASSIITEHPDEIMKIISDADPEALNECFSSIGTLPESFTARIAAQCRGKASPHCPEVFN